MPKNNQNNGLSETLILLNFTKLKYSISLYIKYIVAFPHSDKKEAKSKFMPLNHDIYY